MLVSLLSLHLSTLFNWLPIQKPLQAIHIVQGIFWVSGSNDALEFFHFLTVTNQ
jgi:hypothetical protein